MKAAGKLIVFVCVISALVAGSVSCKKKKSSTTPTPTPTPTTPAPTAIDINHSGIAEYEVEGAKFSYPSNGITGGMGTSASYAASMSGTSTASYSGYYTKGSTTYFSITKGTIKTPGIGRPGEDAFRAFFVVGNVNYSPNNVDGIVIEHTDASGTLWTTDKGNALQTGSVFKIETVKEIDANYQQMKIYATFNCKLYDDNGNSKTLTNGKFVGYFENN